MHVYVDSAGDIYQNVCIYDRSIIMNSNAAAAAVYTFAIEYESVYTRTAVTVTVTNLPNTTLTTSNS